MNQPVRYNYSAYAGAMLAQQDGRFVKHEDYAILADRLARLTAELDNAKIAIDGLQNTLRKEREQHHKAQDELEHKQRECEGLRLWAEALEKDWLTREQWALIGGGMRLEQALIHANARMKQARAATIKAALSSGEKNDGHA